MYRSRYLQIYFFVYNFCPSNDSDDDNDIDGGHDDYDDEDDDDDWNESGDCKISGKNNKKIA